MASVLQVCEIFLAHHSCLALGYSLVFLMNTENLGFLSTRTLREFSWFS